MSASSRKRIWDGDTFEHRGYTFRLTVERDDYMSEPWKEHDGHGPVSEWTRREKRPGERLLVSDGRDYGSKRYYDVQEATRIARRDGWGPVSCQSCGGAAGGIGTPAYGTVHETEAMDQHHPFRPESKRAQAARAVERDYEYLRSWCRDEWEWLSVTVEHVDDGKPTGLRESLSGIDGDHDNGKYITEVAYELAAEIVSQLEVDTPDVVVSEN